MSRHYMEKIQRPRLKPLILIMGFPIPYPQHPTSCLLLKETLREHEKVFGLLTIDNEVISQQLKALLTPALVLIVCRSLFYSSMQPHIELV
ncbi:MAG: hypothetical protein PUP90_06385 [Nostoc sp. S4]|nr:hypothetical protein [Nostoc sp. S4]